MANKGSNTEEVDHYLKLESKDDGCGCGGSCAGPSQEGAAKTSEDSWSLLAKIFLFILIVGLSALAVVGGKTLIGSNSHVAIVEKVLAYHMVPFSQVEVLQYSTYPTKSGVDLENIIAQGVSNGNIFRLKIQYQEGRDPSQNGYQLELGTMTTSSGQFFNF